MHLNFPIFVCFILFVLWLNYEIRKNERNGRKKDQYFWDKEHRSNFVRKKPLDNLPYIQIPMGDLPFGALPEDETVLECETAVRALSGSNIVNLTGISNTDLKLEYGTANLPVLMEYDQNYTSLVSHLQKWAKALYDAALYPEARSLLEFAISTHTDIAASYRLLCQIYLDQSGLGETEAKERIRSLIPLAEKLHSLNRDQILSDLHQMAGDPLPEDQPEGKKKSWGFHSKKSKEKS